MLAGLRQGRGARRLELTGRPQYSWQWICGECFIMEHYLVELDGDQIELLKGMVREAMKVADEKKIAELEGLISALGIMSWKAGDRRAD
jgi:hypothetical protein